MWFHLGAGWDLRVVLLVCCFFLLLGMPFCLHLGSKGLDIHLCKGSSIYFVEYMYNNIMLFVSTQLCLTYPYQPLLCVHDSAEPVWVCIVACREPAHRFA